MWDEIKLIIKLKNEVNGDEQTENDEIQRWPILLVFVGWILNKGVVGF